MARRYWRRFLLPFALLGASLASWTGAGAIVAEPRAATSSVSSVSFEELSVPVVSIRRVPEFVTASRFDNALDGALAIIAEEPGGLSCVTVFVDATPVLDVRGDRNLVPAYAQLLITAHAAIDVLGPDFRFETRVMAAALPDAQGRIVGDVYLVGGGDPGLMTNAYALGLRTVRSTRSSVEELAQGVVEAGALSIEGGVVAVERRYDDERRLPGWPQHYTDEGVVGPLSALLFDNGFITAAGDNGGLAVAAEQPAAFAAERFAELLAQRNIEISGPSRVLGADEELPELVQVARLESPPLGEIVGQMLRVNDATTAEMILKELGVGESGIGNTQAGARVVQRVVEAQGTRLDVPFRDASGIDPVGGTTCRQLAQIADAIPDDHPTLEVLPPYDIDGVFAGPVGAVPVAADLRLVGGVVGDAGGFVARTVGDGPRVTVASVVNRLGGPHQGDLEFQQALVAMVDDLRVPDALAELAPGQG